jgi:hypothetical protein
VRVQALEAMDREIETLRKEVEELRKLTQDKRFEDEVRQHHDSISTSNIYSQEPAQSPRSQALHLPFPRDLSRLAAWPTRAS